MSHRSLHTAVAAALSVAVLALVPAEALAQKTARRVGIVVTTRVNVSKKQATELSKELGRALGEKLQVDVIAGQEVVRRLPPEGVPQDCIAAADCRNDVGSRLDAEELLMLVVVRLGDRIKIDPTWTNVASGETRSRDAVVLEEGADRAKVLARAAPRLLPHIEERRGGGTNVVVLPGGEEDDGRHFTTGTWIAAGAGGAALAGALVFTFSAQNKYDSLEGRGCRDMPCPEGDVESLERHALAADLLYGAAIAGGVTAVFLYLRSGGEAEEAPSGSVGPGPGGSAGISVGGRF